MFTPAMWVHDCEEKIAAPRYSMDVVFWFGSKYWGWARFGVEIGRLLSCKEKLSKLHQTQLDPKGLVSPPQRL